MDERADVDVIEEDDLDSWERERLVVEVRSLRRVLRAIAAVAAAA